MDKVLRHKYLIRVHCLAQQVLAHVGDGLFAQVRAVTQPQGAALELWCTALQQHFAEQAHLVAVALGLKCTNVQHDFNLADLIASPRFPAA